MEVDKTQFDEVLGKLLKAPPLPKSAIPTKRDRPKSVRPKLGTQKPLGR
jgi:hypothetical protein